MRQNGILDILGEDGNWDFQAQFDLVEDFVGEDDVIDEDYHPDVTDSFREVFAVTPGQDRLFVYTSDDHLMGFDPNTSAYFYFGERGNHLEAIDEVDSPELPDLRVASYHPSFIWPYTRLNHHAHLVP
ncbi:hypothetical protein DM860_005103 [Cuscuta australis]|uniref:Uncharacterized protein n=1 Tax=Cuscuta australis TaxID=267555 RepID=A0A328DMJ4_9ASTE|nr:hypothetical protein DM860_005103 [Cuscuta australis]